MSCDNCDVLEDRLGETEDLLAEIEKELADAEGHIAELKRECKFCAERLDAKLSADLCVALVKENAEMAGMLQRVTDQEYIHCESDLRKANELLYARRLRMAKSTATETK